MVARCRLVPIPNDKLGSRHIHEYAVVTYVARYHAFIKIETFGRDISEVIQMKAAGPLRIAAGSLTAPFTPVF